MTEAVLIEWKRMKAIELRLRTTTTTRRGEPSLLRTELYEAMTEFASAFSADQRASAAPNA